MTEFDFGPGLRIEERIDAAEADGISERWEFGRWMLSVQDGKKQLPNGFIEALSSATGKSERELRYRRQFAERFPDESEVGTAVQTYSSWTEIREKALPKDPHVGKNSGENEWYTPLEFIEAANATMGRVDLDPASSAEANKIVGAKKFFTEQEDGLAQKWEGRVWMNPPYSRPLVDQFCEKLADSYAEESVTAACVLVNNATETSWFQVLTDVTAAVFFPAKRVKFWQPGGEKGAPLQGQAVLYLGSDARKFRDEFHKRISGWSAWL